MSLQGHTGFVNFACFQRDTSSIAATASTDQTIKIWDVRNPQLPRCLQTLKGHGDSVNRCDFHPINPALIASASSDNTLRIWHWPTGTCVYIFKSHKKPVLACRFHPHGTHLASASADKTIKIHALYEAQEKPPKSSRYGRIIDEN